VSDTTKKKRTPVKRWIILALVALGVFCAWFGPGYLKPIAPLVVLPGEPTGISIAGFQITNTILATLLADVVLLLFALGAYRFAKSGKLVPKGLYNFFEWIVDMFWNMAEGAAPQKWARRIFLITGTIFLLVFTANMIKLFPGFESIGYLKEAHGNYGYKAIDLGFAYVLDKNQDIKNATHAESETTTETGHEETDVETHAASGYSPDKYYEVVPYFRGSATDLNFTAALAVVTVVAVQVFGIWALGPGYLSKFFQFKRLVSGGPFGMIDFGVGLLEIILEFAKILSFAFRLFGNIFAGALLLAIVGALTAVVVPAGLYIFEVFFGIIQAYVFSLLALMFISQALVSHHGDDHKEHAEAH
jgi:F-type H+-transporting ATPase subunit a